MGRIAAVLLDIDGTLLFSNEFHARAFVLAAEELGFATPGVEEVLRLIGMGGDKLIPQAFGFSAESEKGRALDARKGEIFRSRFGPQLRPTPGARELLERFRDPGLRRVVATSANEEDLKLLLGAAGIADLVDACTTSDDVEESKPDPDIVEAALELAEVGADRAVMLGDTPYDVEAATRAGVRIVGVETGGWNPAALAGAVRVYASPEAILKEYASSPFA